MIEKWRSMSSGDQLRVQILLACAVVGAYAILYLFSSQELFESERMLSRRKNRIETRTSMDEIDDSGMNTRTLKNRITQVDEQLQKTSEAIEKLDARFAPVDSSDVQQQLMLEISTLAKQAGVELLSVSRVSYTHRGEAPAEISVHPVLGRPMLAVSAKSRFLQLLTFLDELESLSYHVSVMSLKLHSRDRKDNQTAEGYTPTNDLQIQLQLSM